MVSSAPAGEPGSFDDLVALIRSRLRPVLWSRWGPEVGGDLCGEVEEYAWTHRERLLQMTNPLGFLYRVSQSKARRYTRWSRRNCFPDEFPDVVHDDPDLHDTLQLLAGLTADQRACVLLTKGFGWSYDEVAELLGMTRAAVNNHIHRGLTRLRVVHNADGPSDPTPSDPTPSDLTPSDPTLPDPEPLDRDQPQVQEIAP